MGNCVVERGEQSVVLRVVVGLMAKIFTERGDLAAGLISDNHAIPRRPGIAAGPAIDMRDAAGRSVFGAIDQPGQYFVLIRWHPGYMSAPHWYETDRLCVVLSGTWYVASGEDFASDATVPVPAGSFVHRVAKTPHYDGVKKGVAEPAIIAISGIGPIHYHLTDQTKPGWREL